MVFSSNLFIFGFMPVFFAAYYLLPWPGKNVLLLLASLAFYEFGAGPVVIVLIASIIINYAGARAIEISDGTRRRVIFWLVVVANVAALFYYKYFGFAWLIADEVIGGVLSRQSISAPHVVLPIGISFFTFQALSYVADVYTKHCSAETSLIRFGMYHSLFPQLIAGPIVRYVEIQKEIGQRAIFLNEIAEGLTRFAIGLAKKVIIADHAGQIADRVFSLGPGHLTQALAWLGAIAYGIQILYDFAGYSDMAIGLGRLLGFRFPENFADPYISQNITEFWRRWHMTLSRWFRDYVYIPLGGNRHGEIRTYLNLLVVFFLCGLWHGAGNTFVVWGLFHGTFLTAERVALHRWHIAPRGVLGQLYTLTAVTISWVLFRATTIGQAIDFLKVMLFPSVNGFGTASLANFPARDDAFYLVIGIVLAIFPLRGFFVDRPAAVPVLIIQRVAALLLLIYSAAILSEGAFNPFIYFRF